MSSAKDILIKPIAKRDADKLIKKYHYSHKVVNNSNLHFGVFYNDKCEGAMSFGSPTDKRKVIGLVENTLWHEMLEINRMAFSDNLPRFSESRALSVAFRIIKKNYPQIKWILSFSDACQCGDGTIYRAAGFILTSIKTNKSIIQMPDGEIISTTTLTANFSDPNSAARKHAQRYGITLTGAASFKPFMDKGGKFLEGYQLRYIYLLDKTAKLTCPNIPFEKIKELGIGMYKGEKQNAVNKGNLLIPSTARRINTDLTAPI
jgi:hypothetical protein